MGMKDQSQNKAGELKQRAKGKGDQARQQAGQRGKQQASSERGLKHENMRDIEDSDQEMKDRFDRDYDA
ncbi:hypothetical protein [Streptomyces monashensis]|uniref:Uncharacterized protein n=1 Tax=Streptomyces monashensis TaxID=1678012 RepID=A0A1S2QMD7_9ACTN|nr:hypothetical protein [Streptomyces monashensis]OIK07254.1 hypothetical protein BIV23_04025 [Streptomyces monashensis]